MAHSFIDYRGNFVRANDQILTIIAILASDAVAKGGFCADELQLVSEWKQNAIAAPPGMIDFGLEGKWENQNGRVRLLAIMDAAKRRLNEFGEMVDGNWLNQQAQAPNLFFVNTAVPLIEKSLVDLSELISSSKA